MLVKPRWDGWPLLAPEFLIQEVRGGDLLL